MLLEYLSTIAGTQKNQELVNFEHINFYLPIIIITSTNLFDGFRVSVFIDVQPMSRCRAERQVDTFLWQTLLVKTSTHGADEDVLHRKRVGDLVLKL